MKRVITILLMLIILLAGNVKSLLVVSYEFHKDYISKNICINRSNPTMGCHGKCYLNKKIKQQEEQEKNSQTESKNMEIVWSIIPSFDFVFQFNDAQEICYTTAYIVGYYKSPVNDFFNPPQ